VFATKQSLFKQAFGSRLLRLAVIHGSFLRLTFETADGSGPGCLSGRG